MTGFTVPYVLTTPDGQKRHTRLCPCCGGRKPTLQGGSQEGHAPDCPANRAAKAAALKGTQHG